AMAPLAPSHLQSASATCRISTAPSAAASDARPRKSAPKRGARRIDLDCTADACAPSEKAWRTAAAPARAIVLADRDHSRTAPDQPCGRLSSGCAGTASLSTELPWPVAANAEAM